MQLIIDRNTFHNISSLSTPFADYSGQGSVIAVYYFILNTNFITQLKVVQLTFSWIRFEHFHQIFYFVVSLDSSELKKTLNAIYNVAKFLLKNKIKIEGEKEQTAFQVNAWRPLQLRTRAVITT